ncbi:MAG: cadherin repeat domain-containing protein, partial [Verrucomicrobiales bacterium]|nr:cadherin repeat domain-containing protein [Verrucomicrobiales bacterium]
WGGATAGSLSMASGALITNLAGATFDLELDAIVADSGGAGGFANDGVFRKTGGAGVTTFTTPFRNNGSMELRTGKLQLNGGFTQTAGTLLLRGGQLASVRPVRILGGRMSGSGTVLGSLTNAGWIQPGDGPGLLILDGPYTQDHGGSLEVRLGGDTPVRDYDQLVISNLAALDGTLVATLAEGFEPTLGAGFEILRCASRTGAFSTLQYPSNSVGMTLEYTSSNVIVRVTNTRPVLDPIPDQVLDASGSLSLTVIARDADLPPQALRFTLTNAPAGATIDDTGLLRWSTTSLQPGSSTNITVVVTDNGTPNLSASRTFLVQAGSSPGLAAVSLQFGVPAPGANTLSFRGVPGTTYHAEYGLSILGPWFDFASATAGSDGTWTVVDSSATNTYRFYRAR